MHCTFDDDCVCGQIHTPSERGSAAQHFDDTTLEHLLCHSAVGPQHTSMVDTYAL